LIAPFVLASNSGESSACSSGISARRCSGDNRLQVGLLGMSFLSKLSRFEVAGGRLVQAGICAVKLRVPTAARNSQRRTLTPTVQAFCSTAHIGDERDQHSVLRSVSRLLVSARCSQYTATSRRVGIREKPRIQLRL
jgi:hypothetical protein